MTNTNCTFTIREFYPKIVNSHIDNFINQFMEDKSMEHEWSTIMERVEAHRNKKAQEISTNPEIAQIQQLSLSINKLMDALGKAVPRLLVAPLPKHEPDLAMLAEAVEPAKHIDSLTQYSTVLKATMAAVANHRLPYYVFAHQHRLAQHEVEHIRIWSEYCKAQKSTDFVISSIGWCLQLLPFFIRVGFSAPRGFTYTFGFKKGNRHG